MASSWDRIDVFGTPDLLVIADGTDPFAYCFAKFAKSTGWIVEQLTYAAASGRLSITRSGAIANVSPVIPILLRLPFATDPWVGGETQFHHNEICSLVWAAAALSGAPVVNRPDSFGLSGRSALSTSVVHQRAGLGLHGPEVFASHPPDPLGPIDEWWLECQVDRVTLPWSERGMKRGPYRAGHVRPGFKLHFVPVVGSHAFGDTPPNASPDMRAMSVQICTALNIAFATVTWRWYVNEGVAEFARLNPYPTLKEIDESWEDVARQLLLELSQ